MQVPALAILIPEHYLKRLKHISFPFGDVLLANYHGFALGHVLELQRVTSRPVSQSWNASPTLRKLLHSPTEPKAGAGPRLKDLAEGPSTRELNADNLWSRGRLACLQG